MSLLEWLPLALVCLMGAATPGPSLAIIANTTIANGLNAGRFATISHAIGVGIYALGAVLGLAALFQLFPIIAKILMYTGAAYLAYLGVKLLLPAKPDKSNIDTTASEQNKNEGVKQAFLIAFLNPKLAIFFFALFSQFIPTEGANLTLTVILVGTVLIIDMAWYLAIVQLIDKVKHKVKIGGKGAGRIKKLQGLIFIAIAFNAIAINI